jgi:uncharacterized protein with NRDE domain
MFLSKQVDFEQNRYKTTKKLRDSIALVSNQIGDANYFHWKKMRMHKIILISSEKIIQYEKLIPVVTEKLLIKFQSKRESLHWSRPNRNE